MASMTPCDTSAIAAESAAIRSAALRARVDRLYGLLVACAALPAQGQKKALQCWRRIIKRCPRMFAHWEWIPSVPSVW